MKYTEGRFLPYFFPDTFHEGGDPVKEAKENWVTARRAILRKPIDRIGYGGYLKLACQFPEFIGYVESVCDEFRELYDNIRGRRRTASRAWRSSTAGAGCAPGAATWSTTPVPEAELLPTPASSRRCPAPLRREVHQL